MADSYRAEILRQYAQAENHINKAGTDLYECLLVFEQAENILKTKYKDQRELLISVMSILKMATEGIDSLRRF